MPGNFPLVELRNFDSWIPTTDIDGIDAKPEVLADVESMDFENGYIQNTYGVSVADLPAAVTAAISAGYAVYSIKKFDIFYSETVNSHTLYVMYKASDATLKIYVDDTQIPIDGSVTTGIVVDEPPNHINYNFSNNSLKINLNCIGTFASITGSPTVILNLSLIYIDVLREYTGTSTINKEGWSLQPRWIGWQNTDVLAGSVGGTVGDLLFDQSNTWVIPGSAPYYRYTVTSLESSLIYTNESDVNTSDTVDYDKITFSVKQLDSGRGTRPYKFYIVNSHTDSSVTALLKILHPLNIRDIDKIKIHMVSSSLLSTDLMDLSLKIYEIGSEEVKYSWDGGKGYLFDNELDVNLLCSTDKSYRIEVTCVLPAAHYVTSTARGEQLVKTYAFLESFEIIPHNLAIVIKTDDGQRGLIQYKGSTIANDYTVHIPTTKIDWRITGYELYVEWNGIYYLAKTFGLSGVNAVAIYGTDVYFVLNLSELTSTTLNYNYNLPFDKRVDNQRKIYSEVAHKGRVYFVNEDEKVYQSHISANGATQPDAFPYDEDTGFGYFVVNRDKQNKALAVTPDNNLGIFTSTSFYVYFIQASGNGTYKQLKLISGSVGVSSINSITRTLNGEPSADGLFWCDRNGVYVYFGGVDVPINLIVPTHENYWNAISNADKDVVVIFYNVKDREIWVCFNNMFGYYSVMIYEIPYKKWKKRIAGSGLIQEYCGLQDNVFYFRYGDLLFKYDYSVRSEGSFVTHRASPNSENYWNILQEVIVMFDESSSDNGEVALQVNAICDSATLPLAYTLSTEIKTHKLLMPLGFRFKSIYFGFVLTTVNFVRIKSLRYTYSEDINEMLGQNVVHSYDRGYGVTPFGEEFGN